MPLKANIKTGQEFGRWTILNEASRNKHKQRRFKCECNCGTIKIVNMRSLLSGASTSCGCYNKEVITKHGQWDHPLYNTWNLMKQRCYNIKSESYKDYGERGIRICDEWLKDVNCFILWSDNNNWKKGLQIDRINNNGNYEPSNCRWTTTKVQTRNYRRNRIVTIFGETMTLVEAIEKHSYIKYGVVLARLDKLGWSLYKSLFHPIKFL